MRPPDAAAVRGQLERLAASAEFRDAQRLSSLLVFVVERQIEGRAEEIKESTIAIEVFGKSADFDGRLDNVVRVNASRLRNKLAAYYAGEGRLDEVVIDIPRGAYTPRISARGERAEPGPSRRWPWVVAAALLVAGAVGMAWWMGVRQGERNAGRDVPPPVRDFYARLAGRPVTIIYRVPVFLRMNMSYPLMLLYDGHTIGQTYERVPLPADVPEPVRAMARNGTARFENAWSDIGSIHGVFQIGNILGRTGVQVSLQDSLGVNADQCRGHNLVVVSPPWFSNLMPQLPPMRHFIISVKDPIITDPGAKEGAGRNFTPMFDPNGGAMRTTWGLVSLGPGISPGTRLLRISGLNPHGVAGAANYISSAEGLVELAKALGNPARLPDSFEAVLRVECLKGQVGSVSFARGVVTP